MTSDLTNDGVVFNDLGVRVWVLPEHFAATADFYEGQLALKCSWRDDVRRVATFELGYGGFIPGPGAPPVVRRPR